MKVLLTFIRLSGTHHNPLNEPRIAQMHIGSNMDHVLLCSRAQATVCLKDQAATTEIPVRMHQLKISL